MNGNDRKPGIRLWLGVASLFAVAFVLVFAPCWTASTLITHDESILRLPLLTYWRNVPTIFSEEFMIFSNGLYRPLSYALIAVVRSIVPADAAVFWHTVLILLHALNGFLVFLLARHVFEHVGAAILSAAVFCFHPVAAVLANQINEIHILLGVSLYLISLLCWLSFRRRENRLWFALGLLAFALGLLASPVVATVPLVLLVYELACERHRARHATVFLLPFLVVLAAFVLLWGKVDPHPLLYKYSAAEGGEWPSFYSMVAGGHWYAFGLLAGRQVPVVLDDLVVRTFTWRTVAFLFWASIGIALLGIAVWRVVRKDFVGVAILLMVAAMLPFATTAWNPVEAYVSWVYLYAPLVGFALIVGAIADRLLPLQGRQPRAIGLALLLLLVALQGYRLLRINVAARSPLTYWNYVLALGPKSETAQVELGKAYLADGQTDTAMKYLFTPDIAVLEPSCDAMCRYYLERGEWLLAIVHLGFSENPLTWVRLLNALGMPDHAEAALGRALANDPFDTTAMRQLAEILTRKGFVPAARRWLDQALEIDPSDAAAKELLHRLETNDLPTGTVTPQAAERLRFLVEETTSPHLQEEFLRLDREHPEDPMATFRAAYCLLCAGRLAPATSKLHKLYLRLASVSPVAAVFAHALILSGNTEDGEIVVYRAIKRNPSHPSLNYVMGYLLAKQKQYDRALAHLAASLAKDPDAPGSNFNMGRLLLKKGMLKEAVPYLEKVVKKNPHLLLVHIALATAYTELGETEKAMRHYTAAEQLEPGNPRTQHDWAIACFRTRDFAGAWRHVHKCRELGGGFAPAFLRELQSRMPEPPE